MKTLKLILVITVLALCVEQLKAQSARAGIKAGANFSNLFIDDVDDENLRMGFHAGVYGQYLEEGSTLGLQTEILYSTKGATATYDNLFGSGKSKFNLNYVDVPILLVIKLGDLIELQGGGYVGFLTKASVSTEGDFGNDYDELDRENFKSVDYGLSGGMAINLEALTIGLRYSYGLNPIAKSEDAKDALGDAKNSVAQIYLGLNIF